MFLLTKPINIMQHSTKTTTQSNSAENMINSTLNNVTSSLTNITSVLQLQKAVNKKAVDNEKKMTDLSEKMAFITEQALGECPVCYCAISFKNSCCMPKCGHSMCVKCYYNWTNKQGKNTCPMCRDNIFSRDTKLLSTLLRLNGESKEHLQILRGSLEYYKNKIREKQEELDNANQRYEEMTNQLSYGRAELKMIEIELTERDGILNEMDLYLKDSNKWKKAHDVRIKREISLARRKWRKSMKQVNIQVKEKANIRKIVNSGNLIKWHDSITPFMKLEMERICRYHTKIIKNNLKFDEEEIGLGDTILADDGDIEMETSAELDLQKRIRTDTNRQGRESWYEGLSWAVVSWPDA